MGFFDKLFGKKKQSKASQTGGAKKQNQFINNANEFGLGDIELGIAGKVRVDGILAIAAMEKIAKAKGEAFKYSVMHTTLLEEGALTVPVVCTLGVAKYSLYFIYQEEDLLKYKDLVKHVARTPYPNLIYFSSIPIYEGYTPKPIIEPFQLADLRHDKGAKIAGRFAMWWSTEQDPHFHQSKSFDYLNKLNDLMNGYETYMTGYVLRQTRILPEQELKRVRLPEQNATYVIDAPEEKKVVLDISQEKGIRFLFSIDDTPVEYRERFIKGVMVDFAASIIPLRQHQVPTDEKMEPNSYDWFNFMSKIVKEREIAGELSNHQIGLIDFNAHMN
ncbi:MAG: hypothetical protein AAF985_19855 [Bacteroidota bacterium]